MKFVAKTTLSNSSTKYSFFQRLLAWLVHLFTASGILAGFMAILAIQEEDWQMAMLWLLLCQIIDGVDGTLARKFEVKAVLPFMDGKSIDYVIDFASYALIPAYFFYTADLVFEAWKLPLTFLMLLVSAIYYGKEGMVADEEFFVGFPVLWNWVLFYMIFVFQFSPTLNIILIILLSILHFVPIKFAYPSRAQKLKWLTISVAGLGIVGAFTIVLLYPEKMLGLTILMILIMAYFAILGVHHSLSRS